MDWIIINQRALARKAGVSRWTLDRIIRQGKSPTLATAQKLAAAMDVTVDAFCKMLEVRE